MLSILKGQPVIGPSRVTPMGYTMPGHEGLVVEVSKTTITLIEYTVSQVIDTELEFEAFFERYQPLLDLSVTSRAAMMRTAASTILKPTAGAKRWLEHLKEKSMTPIEVKQTAKQQSFSQLHAVYRDHQGRTCIAPKQLNGVAELVELQNAGIEFTAMPAAKFQSDYKLIADYPPERAAQLYAEYSQYLGASEDALKFLGRLITITDKEYQVATEKAAKKTPSPKKAAEKPEAKKPAAEKKAAAPKPAKAEPKKPATATDKPKAPKAPKAESDGEKKPRNSASQRFKDLIMEGKKTDDEIFETVKKEFGLDDSKRSYVAWNRAWLRKNGQNPPNPKDPK